MERSKEFVEVVRFPLNPGTTDSEILAAEVGMKKYLADAYPGFVGRELLKGKDGLWLVILRMESEQHMIDLLGRLKGDAAPEVMAYRKCGNLKESRLEFYQAG